jgi:hypothetical protein
MGFFTNKYTLLASTNTYDFVDAMSGVDIDDEGKSPRKIRIMVIEGMGLPR